MSESIYNISTAYKLALDYAKKHYENFPVVSLFIPTELRKHVAIIYWFARTADNLADEEILEKDQRLKTLTDFESSLTDLLNCKFKSAYHEALYHTINERKLSSELFYDLLSAFKQDVIKERYNNFQEVLDYCRYSANPIGRLMLQLFNIKDQQAYYFSDKICSALQLTNFYQDIEIDFLKNRIYLAIDEMKQFGVTEKMFENKEDSSNLSKLLEQHINRTQSMFNEGKNLLRYLKGRLKLEIKCTILGGETILKKIRENNYQIFNMRHALTKKDFGALFIKSFFSIDGIS